jgi:hypothetical protein
MTVVALLAAVLLAMCTLGVIAATYESAPCETFWSGSVTGTQVRENVVLTCVDGIVVQAVPR